MRRALNLKTMSSAKRVLITSGPTREYLDPIRYLSNGSSGRMGAALAEAVLERGDVPVVVSGPVLVAYPEASEVHRIETTDQMLQCCEALFPDCVGVIGAAAPCDYRPKSFSEQKLSKSRHDGRWSLELVETPDILATLGRMKRNDQWIVGFALETENGVEHALEKLKRKNCDFIALNSPASINSDVAKLQIFDATGNLRTTIEGPKKQVASEILRTATTG